MYECQSYYVFLHSTSTSVIEIDNDKKTEIFSLTSTKNEEMKHDKIIITKSKGEVGKILFAKGAQGLSESRCAPPVFLLTTRGTLHYVYSRFNSRF